MTARRRPPRGLGAVLGLAVAALSAMPASAAADGPLRVVRDGRTLASFSFAQLSSESEQQYSYTIHAPGGGDETVTPQAVPVRQILIGAGLNPDAVGFVQVTRPVDGSWATLSRADLADGHPTFPDGPAVVIPSNPTLHYLRPQRSTEDVNARDNFSAGTLDLVVHGGSPLAVSAAAAPRQTDAGTTVRLSATVAPARPGVSYTWTFGDGTPDARGAQVTHTYAAAGFYRPVVTAAAAGDSGGADSVSVQVGSAPPAKPHGTTTTGGEGSPTGPATGPDRGGDHGDTGPATTRHPRGPGRHGPATSAPHGRAPRSRGGTAAGGAPSSGGGAGRPTTPPASRRSPAKGSRRGHPAPQRDRSRGRRVSAARAEPLVEGQLVAAVDPRSAVQAITSASGRAGAIAARPPGTRPITVPLGGLAVILLLGWGAVRESPELRSRWRRGRT